MTKNNIENKFLLLRKVGLQLSTITHTKIPRTLLRRIFRFSRTNVTIQDFDGDITMELLLSEHMQRRIFWMGYYNEDIAFLLDKILKPGMTVLDVGANIGEVALLAAKRVGPEGKVFAFEPIDAIAEKLKRHVEINNFDQIHVESCALGDAVDDNRPIYASCGQTGTDPNNGLGSLYGSKGEQPLQHIHMTTLDTWLQEHPSIQRIDVIKIDIEGAELACLTGAKKCLQRFKPSIIVEIQDFSSARAGYQPADILDFLSGFGYTFDQIGRHGTLTPLSSDTLRDFQNVLCTPRSAVVSHS